MEVRLSNQQDTSMANLMELIQHNLKMGQEQRETDSTNAGKRMDGLSAEVNAVSTGLAQLFKGMEMMTAKLDALTPPTKRDPQKAARVSNVHSVAAAVAVLEAANVQSAAGALALKGT